MKQYVITVLLGALLLLAGCSGRDGLSSSSHVSSEDKISDFTESSEPIESTASQEESKPESLAPQESSNGPSASAENPSNGVNSDATVIDPEDNWQLMLINKQNILPEGYTPKTAEVAGMPIDERVAPFLKEFMNAAAENGINLSVISGYRRYSTSERLYNNKVAEYVSQGYSKAEAELEAGKWIAPPGTSEHNAGVSADLMTYHYFQGMPMNEEMGKLEEYKWLAEHCAEYGFILRYPADKEDITGIHYEPWHFRYVGEKAAREIMSQGVCLEEYLNS